MWIDCEEDNDLILIIILLSPAQHQSEWKSKIMRACHRNLCVDCSLRCVTRVRHCCKHDVARDYVMIMVLTVTLVHINSHLNT